MGLAWKFPAAAIAFLALALALAVQAATPGIREVPVHFQKGESGATNASSTSAYFNVLPPGSETALFVGSTSGERFEGTLPADGVYRIRVCLMRSAARRSASTSYKPDAGVSGPVPRHPPVASP